MYSLHPAVCKAATVCESTATFVESQTRFVDFTFRRLHEWAKLFFSSAWEVALTLARNAAADISASFSLAGVFVQS
jgi:hypothetical protein